MGLRPGELRLVLMLCDLLVQMGSVSSASCCVSSDAVEQIHMLRHLRCIAASLQGRAQAPHSRAPPPPPGASRASHPCPLYLQLILLHSFMNTCTGTVACLHLLTPSPPPTPSPCFPCAPFSVSRYIFYPFFGHFSGLLLLSHCVCFGRCGKCYR